MVDPATYFYYLGDCREYEKRDTEMVKKKGREEGFQRRFKIRIQNKYHFHVYGVVFVLGLWLGLFLRHVFVYCLILSLTALSSGVHLRPTPLRPAPSAKTISTPGDPTTLSPNTLSLEFKVRQQLIRRKERQQLIEQVFPKMSRKSKCRLTI